MIREVETNSDAVATNKAFLNWARGVLTKRGSHKKGFEFKIVLPLRLDPFEVYGDIRGATAWATKLVLCQTFQWDKSKSSRLIT